MNIQRPYSVMVYALNVSKSIIRSITRAKIKLLEITLIRNKSSKYAENGN
jgi:hypothetical protein